MDTIYTVKCFDQAGEKFGELGYLVWKEKGRGMFSNCKEIVKMFQSTIGLMENLYWTSSRWCADKQVEELKKNSGDIMYIYIDLTREETTDESIEHDKFDRITEKREMEDERIRDLATILMNVEDH